MRDAGAVVDIDDPVDKADAEPDQKVPIINAPARWTHQLSQELLLMKTSPYLQFEDFLFETGAIFAQLPEPIIRIIRKYKTDPYCPGTLLISNLPLDPELTDTPADADQLPAKQTYVSEGCLIGIGQLLGEPFGYAEERGGDIIRTVVPNRAHAISKSGEGSEVDFELHTEIAWSDFRPHFIALYCLREDPEGKAATRISECRKALAHMETDDLSVLRQPRFQIGAPESFRAIGTGTQRWSEPKPIITGPASLPEMCLNLNFVQFLDNRAEKAFNSFRHALTLATVAQYISLKPGELLLIDNRKAAHGRTAFHPSFDGRDRWLQQVYLHTDFWSARSLINVSPRIFSIFP